MPRAIKPDCVSKSNVRQTMWRGMTIHRSSLAFAVGGGGA
jgi:hypothetical protein